MDRTKSFGIWVLLGVDALFWGSLFYIYSYGRIRRGGEWPDIIASAVASPLLPAIAVLLVVAAAGVVRRKPPVAFLGLILSLVAWAIFWMHSMEAGLTPRAGNYGTWIYLATVIYAAHTVAALIATGVQLGKEPPVFLGRFLRFLAGVGALFVALFFVW